MTTVRCSFGAIWLVAVLAGAVIGLRAQTPEVVAGRVLSVHCKAKLLRKGSDKDVPLLSPRDIGLGLFAGDRVHCEGTGNMEILISEGERTVTNSPKKGFTITQLPANLNNPQENNDIVLALKGYGVSGATRGNQAASRILWPSQDSNLMPDHLVIRWQPVSQKITVSIMSDSKDSTIWGPTEVDGNSGSFKSEAISSALADYKMKSANTGLVLTITFADASDWEEVHFSLLNGKQEKELKSQLDFWDKHTDGLALRFGRAYSFSRHKLFAEAAAEYESALSSAPESRYLLEDAIQADRLAGRPSRVKELQSRLASLPEMPNQR